MTGTIDWGYDAARLGAIGLTLTETGGGGANGPVSMLGQYTHTLDLSAVRSLDKTTGEYVTDDIGYRRLAPLLKAALEVVGAATYTVTFSTVTRRYTITAAGGGVTAFALTAMSSGATRYLGALTGSALTWASSLDVWHWSYSDVGAVSEWERREGDPDGAEALIGSDGSVRGLSALGVPDLLDFVLPMEPREALRSDESNSGYTARGWTHQRAYRRCKSVEPAVIVPVAGQSHVAYQRPDKSFRTRKLGRDYIGHESVEFSFYLIGEVPP